MKELLECWMRLATSSLKILLDVMELALQQHSRVCIGKQALQAQQFVCAKYDSHNPV
jgi:hypothetical protein